LDGALDSSDEDESEESDDNIDNDDDDDLDKDDDEDVEHEDAAEEEPPAIASRLGQFGISSAHHSSACLGAPGESADPDTDGPPDFVHHVLAHHFGLVRAAAAR